jgi:hypothetical protein
MNVEEYRAELRKMGIDPGPGKAAVKASEFRDVSEKVFQSLVIKIAQENGWLVHHTYDSRRCAAGFPDLVMIRASTGQIIFAELKTVTGRLSKEQEWWRANIKETDAEYYLWKPFDIETIRDVLK